MTRPKHLRMLPAPWCPKCQLFSHCEHKHCQDCLERYENCRCEEYYAELGLDNEPPTLADWEVTIY